MSVFYPEQEYSRGHSNSMETWITMAMPGAACEPDQTVPSTSKMSLAELLRVVQQPKTEDEQDGMDVLRQSLPKSQDIETVRKQNFFSEEITEEERDIIAIRVAFQQRQYAAYEQREKIRKTARIKAVFDYVTDEEISELLKECNQDEEEAVSRLQSQPGCLQDIRKNIAFRYNKPEENCLQPVMTAEQMLAHKKLVKKKLTAAKRKTSDYQREQYRLASRLRLDEAAQHCQAQTDPEKAYEG